MSKVEQLKIDYLNTYKSFNFKNTLVWLILGLPAALLEIAK